jgi:hypothetical protein
MAELLHTTAIGPGVLPLVPARAGGTVQGIPSPVTIIAVAAVAVAITAATGAAPAVLVQRLPTSQALAAE